MKTTVTISDVARVADVSTATVSAVINQNKYVSPALRNRVERAIEKLNYRPNMIARSLKLQETKTIGLIVTKITSPIISPLVRAAGQVAQEKGFDMVLVNTDDDSERERKSLQNLLAKRVDGLLVRPVSGESQSHIVTVSQSVPVVALEREIPGIESIVTNNHETAYNATQHLLAHGYRRIGLIRTPLYQSLPRQRGYQQALEEHGVYDEALVREVDVFGENAYAVARDLINQNVVDAVFATSQSTTLGVIRAAQSLGRRIPGDLAVFGYDDADWMEVTNPPISTTHQPIREMAIAGMERLLALISGEETSSRQTHVFQSSLILRHSCGCSN